MLKRKNSQYYYNDNNNDNIKYDIIYKNLKNCDSIKKKDNSIYFNSTISDETIYKLIEFIEIIRKTTNYIDLYITSKGGYISSLMKFIDYKNQYFNLNIRSIINDECNDCAIILASCCNYRIITKKSICSISPYNNLTYINYWGYFKQYDDNTINIKNILIDLFIKKIKSKITNENLIIYFENSNNNILNSKKCKKLGFIDEII